MFGYGAREAVLQALRGQGQRVFGDPASAAELAAALRSLAPEVEADVDGEGLTVRGPAAYAGWTLAARTLAFAFGWSPTDDSSQPRPGGPDPTELRFRSGSP